jgi:ribosomal protein S18 acetylase RimI-like enzyme
MATMVGETLVRDAAERDLDSVASVLLAANREFEAVLPGAFYRAYLANVLDVRPRFRDAQLLVAERDGRVVGAITLYPDASREGWGWPPVWAGIRAVGVEPEVRGLGIGRELAGACIERSRSAGARAVCLHTASFMGAAVAMYEGIGFRRAPDFDSDAGELFGVPPMVPPIAALAYRIELSRGSDSRPAVTPQREENDGPLHGHP